MSFSVHEMGSLVPESYSRELDEFVSMQEMPYGYTGDAPPADTGDYNMEKLNSRKEYRPTKGRK